MVVKTKELTPKQLLSVPCITCGAGVGEACELHTGAPRTEPHRDRKLSAAEAVETKAATAEIELDGCVSVRIKKAAQSGD